MDKLKRGLTISGNGVSYQLEEAIGKGAFGSVWRAKCARTQEAVAIKFELPVKTSRLQKEIEILQACNREATEEQRPYFPRYYGHGFDQGLNFIIMEKLGRTLRGHIESNPNRFVTTTEAFTIGIGMLKAIRAFHELGYVHRDIKPSNFMFREGAGATDLCLIDFGLARKWRADDGTALEPRPAVGFRGTVRYASVNSHAGKDLGRRDDLYSWLYILLEMYVQQTLPWTKEKADKDFVVSLKNSETERLISQRPLLGNIWSHIKELEFDSTPDYDFIISELDNAIADSGDQEGVISLSSMFSSFQAMPMKAMIDDTLPADGSDAIDEMVVETPKIQEEVKQEPQEAGGCCNVC